MSLILKGTYYTTADAAEYLKCSPAHLKNAVASGKVKAVPVGNTFLFEQRDLDAYKPLIKGRGNPNWKKASEG